MDFLSTKTESYSKLLGSFQALVSSPLPPSTAVSLIYLSPPPSVHHFLISFIMTPLNNLLLLPPGP